MENFFSGSCVETVSILYAAIFGAGEACIDIGMGSVVQSIVGFFVAVLIVQFIARKLWHTRGRALIAAILAPILLINYLLGRSRDGQDRTNVDPEERAPSKDEGPIRQSRF